MDDQAIEQQIQAKGKTAPRVTPADIEANIASEHYFTAMDGVAAAVAGTICATKKPDADNVLKGIKDGCNGIVWADDAQVVRIMIEKRYSETPSAVVHVVEVAGEAA